MQRLGPTGDVVDVLEPYRTDRTPPDGRPWVLANMVCDLAGSTTIDGRVGVLSSGTDAVLFRRMRTLADVVLVGAETVRRERYGPVRWADDDGGRPTPPPIAVVSRSLDFDWTIPLFAPDNPVRPIVVTVEDADPAALASASRHADVVQAGSGSVDLAGALERLAERGAATIVCEGGPHLLGELVACGVVDELCLTLSPLLGGDPLPVAVMPPGGGLHHFALAHVVEDDGTLFLRYRRRPTGSEPSRGR